MLIQLIDGRQIEQGTIFFDDSNYSFKVGGTGEDITPLIRAVDKQTFPGFDQAKYNDIVYVQHYRATHSGAYPSTVGSTSTYENFVNQILTDPLAAPLDSLNSTVSEIFGSSGVKTLLIVGGIIIAAALLYKAQD